MEGEDTHMGLVIWCRQTYGSSICHRNCLSSKNDRSTIVDLSTVSIDDTDDDDISREDDAKPFDDDNDDDDDDGGKACICAS
jgi:hypothetical protein